MLAADLSLKLSTLAIDPHSIWRMYSLIQQLRSWRHGFWFGVSERVRWSRGIYQETPALELASLTSDQTARVADLRARYQVQFESTMNVSTSINNYEYLDILDRAWVESGIPLAQGGTLCDIGCASFWYAASLQAFFRPQRLVGIEIEGHRLFRDGRTRIDYATGYLNAMQDAHFVVADYAKHREPADLITAWFPFLTPAAILAWRLPLSLLAPERLFASIKHNLKPDGLFVMVNHGLKEAALAEQLCAAAGLQPVSRWGEAGTLSNHRLRPPLLSCWRHAA
jgi:SAM-dependent methyltransferase